ncbi:MAG: dTDP-4-dehydrorhamnose reductase [Deltaproteobacteria bacterium]|nr:dTDP-4-dehydrorhamnose reductase [Deltaproteobacteria bacterium]
MNILITGAGGLLGREAAAVLAPRHKVTALTSWELDITDPDRVRQAVQRLAPEVVLNCAAFADVDACESERDRALAVNAAGPGNLALALARYGGKLIHISTDYVFDGQKPPPAAYTEEDAPNPLSWYGKTKLAGENAVKEVLENHAIVRTAWLYGRHGRGFLNLLIDLTVKRRLAEIRVVEDQFGTPTWAWRLAQQLARLIEADARGLFHATAEGWCSRYELARFFLEQMGIDCRIVPCPSTEFPTPAVRPKNSILENKGLKDAGLNLMRDWQEDMAEFAAKFREQLLSLSKADDKPSKNLGDI